MRIVVTRRELAKVIGLDSVAMRFQEIVATVVRHANVSLMAASVANHEGLGPGVDGRDGHGLGVVLLRAGRTVDAAYYRDAPVRSMPNAVEINHVVCFLSMATAICHILAAIRPRKLAARLARH